MRRRIKLMVVLPAIVGLSVGGYIWYRTPPDPMAFLETAPAWTLYSLDPENSPSSHTSTAEFHGYVVLGKVIVNPDKITALLAGLRKGIQENDGKLVKCFEPRLGIGAERDGHAVDLVICYHCHWIHSYYDGERVGSTVTSNSPEPAFDKIFRDEHVPLAPKD